MAGAQWRVQEEIRSGGAGIVTPIVYGGTTTGGLKKEGGAPVSTAKVADLASAAATRSWLKIGPPKTIGGRKGAKGAHVLSKAAEPAEVVVGEGGWANNRDEEGGKGY